MFTSIRKGKKNLAKVNAAKIKELQKEAAVIQNEIDGYYDNDMAGDANLLHRQKMRNINFEIAELQSEIEDKEYNKFLVTYDPMLTDDYDIFSAPEIPSYEEWLASQK